MTAERLLPVCQDLLLPGVCGDFVTCKADAIVEFHHVKRQVLEDRHIPQTHGSLA